MTIAPLLTTPEGIAAETADPEALIQEARARQRQRRIRLLLAGVALVAVGGGLYGGFSGGTSHPPTIPAIERNFTTALAKARTTLVLRLRIHRTHRPLSTDATEWVNLTNGQKRTRDYDASGARQSDTDFSYSNSAPYGGYWATSLTIAYSSKTWSTTRPFYVCGGTSGQIVHCTPHPSPAAACGCDIDPFTNYPVGSPPHISLLGEQTIDGQSTFHLRFVVTGFLAYTADLWIDRATYLPVHETVSSPTKSRRDQPTVTTTNDFTWLPRTSGNLAQLKVAIPSGFKHTAAPR